jgi:4-amino-4-deoxy-L-arabinose transferase-like glycosyltransferase
MEDSAHRHSAPYLYAVTLLGLMPWSLALIPSLVVTLQGTLRSIRKSGLWSAGRDVRAAFERLPTLERFSCLVSFSFVLFFSIPESKRAVYLLPAYPFLALLLSRYIQTRYLAVLSKVLLWIGGTVAVLSVLLPFLPRPATLKGSAAVVIDILGQSDSTRWLVVVGLALLLFRIARNMRLPVARVAALFLISFFIVDYALLRPLQNRFSFKAPARELEAHLDPLIPLYSFNYELYALSFYLNRRITRYTPEAQGYLLVPSNTEQQLLQYAGRQGIQIVKSWESSSQVIKNGRHLALYVPASITSSSAR